MSNDNSLSLAELNDRIAVLRDNIRQLVEQAAASSGAQDEERTSGRMAQQQEELDKLVKARDAMLKKIAARRGTGISLAKGDKKAVLIGIVPRTLCCAFCILAGAKRAKIRQVYQYDAETAGLDPAIPLLLLLAYGISASV
jgi:hypothetical protein